MADSTNLIEIPFVDALGERYLAYALSTIMSRSLPDIRDGLKPVHRRVLYAMHELKLDPKSNFKKCARIVGDAIGKYHPHSDAALYDTLVRLAQDFTLRYPLIEGQGNFGSIDGDNPAAMRYTESKLTPIALELLRDLEEDTVDFKPNYDGQELEPTILPAAFPNLLANGCEGIAVGMATSIPPHNLDELCQALEMLVKNPNTGLEEILTVVKGPDFPTGGLIIEDSQSILQSYKTGRGSFRLRAKWHKEHLGHGLYRIIITEIPYQIQKLRLIEKIADLIKNKKLPLVNDVQDESDANISIAIEPKTRSVDAEVLMESLFKNTDLEIKVSLNLNVLNKDLVPGVINLKEALVSFLEFKEEVVLKRSVYRLNKINHRLEILDGFLITYLNLDEVIRIIREEDEPKEFLINKFSLSEIQVESILNMKLRSLRRLEEFEIRKEHDELVKNKEKLEQIISDEKTRKKIILQELKTIRDKFGIDTPIGARRTEISNIIPEDFGKIDIQAFVEKEPITIVCSRMGWIRSIKGHEDKELKYKEGDSEKFILKANTTDQIMIFTNKGKFYTILGDNLPKSKSFGDSTKLIFDLSDDEEPINIFVYEVNKKLLLVSNNGKGFVLDSNEAVAQTKSGKKILNLTDNCEAKYCINVDGDHIAIIGTNRKLLMMPVTELPNMKKGQGVIIQKYKNSEVSDIKIFNKEDGFSWRYGNGIKVETNLIHWMGKKGASGKMPPIGFPRDNKF